MGRKLIVARIGEGGFERGFPFTFRLSDEETKDLLVEVEGKLPPAEYVYSSYTRWQCCYRNLSYSLRLGASGAQVTNLAVDECLQNIKTLQLDINRWLRDSQVQAALINLFPHLQREDLIRFVIQTDDIRLWQLPWHLWEVWRDYPYIEFALSKCQCCKPPRSNVSSFGGKVRILAILGDRRGIDVERDRQILESLPNTEIVFLDQPSLHQLTPLWEQSWHILFFAGHSGSNTSRQEGVLQINPYEKIEISKLRQTLTKAISNGLELAIFNSCDGLALGFNLADLQLPQTIVMREAVPDEVAQEFLKFFLQSYASDETLYLAVKEAKAKIQELYHLEEKAPGASYLPVICQNLAVNPPLWSDLAKNSPYSLLPRFSLSFNLIAVGVLSCFVVGIGWWLINLKPNLTGNYNDNGNSKSDRGDNTVVVDESNEIKGTPIRAPRQGVCECPHDYDSLGRLCGGKSAYSRQGGNKPVCYLEDESN
ncbi:MAG: CHAT domain-containing protein [Geminocystis sp.]|nr:CHAT domain-containing protein [Geminocystis sp.]